MVNGKENPVLIPQEAEDAMVQQFLEIWNGEFPKKGEGSRDFAGKLFEELSYNFIFQELPPHKFLLNPQQTLNYYKSLFPNTQKVEYTAGFTSLRGIPVPDGLVFDRGWASLFGEPVLTRVLEYTLQKGGQLVETTLHKDRRFRAIQDERPEVFGFAEVCLVTPYFENDFETLTILRDRINLEMLPFTHEDFRHYFSKFRRKFLEAEDTAKTDILK